MNNLVVANIRDLEKYKIESISSMVFDTFQSIYIHYKIKMCDYCCNDKQELDRFTYHNMEEFKRERSILEDILRK